MVNDTARAYSFRRRSTKLGSKKRFLGLQSKARAARPRLAVDTGFSSYATRPIEQVLLPSTHTVEHGITNAASDKQDFQHLGARTVALRNTSTLGDSVGPQQESYMVAAGPITPSVIVTPAIEDQYQALTNTNLELPYKSCRAPSSIYSRYSTGDAAENTIGAVPPVPAIPSHLQRYAALHKHTSMSKSHAHARSTPSSTQPDHHDQYNHSPLVGSTAIIKSAISHASPAGSPGSQGWWNYITSPFSAHSNITYWKSPISDRGETTPILKDMQEMPSVDRDMGIMGHNKTSPVDTSSASTVSPRVDIYHTPCEGEAASYYDRSRHFPSLILPLSDEFVGQTDDTAKEESASDLSHAQSGGVDAIEDAREHPSHHRTVDSPFTSPSAEILTPAAFHILARDHESARSSLSSLACASEVDTSDHNISSRSPFHNEECSRSTPQSTYGQGLAANTMTSRQIVDTSEKSQSPDSAPKAWPLHQRTSSYGLGITGSQKEASFTVTSPIKDQESLEERGGTGFSKLVWPILILSFTAMIIVVTLLVMYVPQRRQDTAVQAQWVNLTGFPALPVGVTTIIQPKNVRSDETCVSPAALWACSAMSASVQSSGSNDILPNFRFEIRFRNDTSFNSSSLQTQHSRRSDSTVPSPPTNKYRTRLSVRDLWSDRLFASSPTPPSAIDQAFLGNTTDNNTAPYEGETTPFYLSILDPVSLAVPQNLHRRQQQVYPLPQQDNTTSQNSPLQTIPKAAVGLDGKAAALPFPLATAQPLRLFKRGLPDEHYGFYMYFDRTVLVEGNITGQGAISSGPAMCTWSQTRFLVQIWTKGGMVADSIPTSDGTSGQSIIAANSTANDMKHPGSFPFPISLTLDRHGGDASLKAAYCHQLSPDGHVNQDQSAWLIEDRASKGILVNPAPVPGMGPANSTTAFTSSQGSDGGTGGCACAWQNW